MFFLRSLDAAALQAVLKLITFYSSVASTTAQHILKSMQMHGMVLMLLMNKILLRLT